MDTLHKANLLLDCRYNLRPYYDNPLPRMRMNLEVLRSGLFFKDAFREIQMRRLNIRSSPKTEMKAPREVFTIPPRTKVTFMDFSGVL